LGGSGATTSDAATDGAPKNTSAYKTCAIAPAFIKANLSVIKGLSLEVVGETGSDVVGDIELFDHSHSSIRMEIACRVIVSAAT
jgi:hypothetical protein